MPFVPLMERPRVKEFFDVGTRFGSPGSLLYLTLAVSYALCGAVLAATGGDLFNRSLGAFMAVLAVGQAVVSLRQIRIATKRLRSARASSAWAGSGGVMVPRHRWKRLGLVRADGIVSVAPGGVSWIPAVPAKPGSVLEPFSVDWREAASSRVQPVSHKFSSLRLRDTDGKEREIRLRDGEGLQAAIDRAAPATAN